LFYYVAYLYYFLHLLDSHSNSVPHHLVIVWEERERLGEGREGGQREGREARGKGGREEEGSKYHHIIKKICTTKHNTFSVVWRVFEQSKTKPGSEE